MNGLKKLFQDHFRDLGEVLLAKMSLMSKKRLIPNDRHRKQDIAVAILYALHLASNETITISMRPPNGKMTIYIALTIH